MVIYIPYRLLWWQRFQWDRNSKWWQILPWSCSPGEGGRSLSQGLVQPSIWWNRSPLCYGYVIYTSWSGGLKVANIEYQIKSLRLSWIKRMCFFQQQPLKMVYDFAIFFEDINLLTLLQFRSCMEYRKKYFISI